MTGDHKISISKLSNKAKTRLEYVIQNVRSTYNNNKDLEKPKPVEPEENLTNEEKRTKLKGDISAVNDSLQMHKFPA